MSLNSKLSAMFPVRQGVRQDGVLPPWLYHCYNNDIPKLLRSCKHVISVGDIICDSVLVADDITLLSLKVRDLQDMISTVKCYGNKWRFELNPTKTTIFTLGESMQMHNLHKTSRKWLLNNVIEENTSWNHVGIRLHGIFSITQTSKTVVVNKLHWM